MDDEVESEVHNIGYELSSFHFNEQAFLAESSLKMPSGSNSYNNVGQSCPRVAMFIKNQQDDHCLKLMMTCAHQNILHAKIVRTEHPHLVAWTELYSGLLIHYLMNMKYNLGNHVGMVPSEQLQTIVSQWFDGIKQLRIYGKYHGNFSLGNTYYSMMKSGMPIVKLTNFRVKAKSEEFVDYSDEKFLLQCQLEDVLAIACALDEICNIAEQWNKVGRDTLDCCLVIDLAKKLRELSKENLVSVMEDIKKHMFFWNEDDVRRFYVCDLPFALRTSEFRDDVEASSGICKIPWDTFHYGGLLQSMNDYRTQHNLPSYDGNKKAQFRSFCSGLHTHEFELPGVKYGNLRVGKVLRHINRKACFETVCLMPDREKKYMLSKRETKKQIVGGVGGKHGEKVLLL